MRRIVIVVALMAAMLFVAFFPYTRLSALPGLATLRLLLHDSGYTRAAEDGFRRILLGFVIWLAFTLYWNRAAKNAAPNQRTESRRFSRINGIMWSGGLLLLFLPIPGLTWNFLPSNSISYAVGLAIQAGGMALAFWARRELGRYWSSEVRIVVGHRLICSGPYQSVRHPMYTAMLCMFVGLAVQSAQLHALLAIPLFLIRYSRKIPAEEKLLEETFGAEYDGYRRRTWALVPHIY